MVLLCVLIFHLIWTGVMSLLVFEKLHPKSEKFKKFLLYVPVYFSVLRNNAVIFAWIKCYIYKHVPNM